MYPRLGRQLMGMCLLGLLVLSLPITPALMFASLDAGIELREPVFGASFDAVAPPAAIVVLGGDGGFGRAQGAIFGGAQLGALSLERVRAGAALQRRTGLPVLITGGALRDDSPPIAALMARSMQDSFNTEVRWIEPRSSETWENAEFTAPMLAREGIKSVYLVTHPWHMRRALVAFGHFGITAWPAPTSLAMPPRLTLDQLLPSVTAWHDSYLAIHEWVGFAVYALRG